MDDILHLDSIPGLANILADDSIDPASFEHSILEQDQPQHYTHRQQITNDHLGRGSKFSQFFQQDCQQMLGQQVSSQFHDDSGMNLNQEAHQSYKGTRIFGEGNFTIRYIKHPHPQEFVKGGIHLTGIIVCWS